MAGRCDVTTQKSSDDTCANGSGGGLGPIGGTEFCEEASDVVFDGSDTQEERLADFAVGAAHCEQSKHIVLAAGQAEGRGGRRLSSRRVRYPGAQRGVFDLSPDAVGGKPAARLPLDVEATRPKTGAGDRDCLVEQIVVFEPLTASSPAERVRGAEPASGHRCLAGLERG